MGHRTATRSEPAVTRFISVKTQTTHPALAPGIFKVWARDVISGEWVALEVTSGTVPRPPQFAWASRLSSSRRVFNGSTCLHRLLDCDFHANTETPEAPPEISTQMQRRIYSSKDKRTPKN